jgi:hypothetical protein
MEFRGLLSNPRFTRALLICCAICAIILFNSIFIIGGADFFQISTTLVTPVVALVASFLILRARAIVKDPNSQQLWFYLGIGFGLWGIAEAIWAIFALWVTDGLPTISIADVLWIIGYVPLYMALAIRLRTLQTRPTTAQKWIIAAISLAWIFFAALIAIRPILVDFDPQRLLEGIILLSYPIGDLGLVILSSIILFMLRGGRYALGWRLIFTGIFVMAFSDILYNYAVWNDLYYPDNQVNFLSNLIDTTYILAYVLSGFGAYVYSLLWEIKEIPDMRIETIPSTRYHAFVGTNRENQIISTSENFPWLVNAKSDNLFYKISLSEACGIDPRLVPTLTDKIIAQGSLYHEPVTITTLDKKTRPVMLSAQATYNTEHEFTGVNFVLQTDLMVPAELQMPKSQDLQAITRYVLSSASARVKEEDQALRAYFLETIRLLLSILYQFGSEQSKNAIFAGINQSIQQKNLKAEFSDQVILISEDYEGDDLSCVLSGLLQTTQSLISKIIGEQVVREKMAEFEQQMSLTMPASLDRNRLRMRGTQSG